MLLSFTAANASAQNSGEKHDIVNVNSTNHEYVGRVDMDNENVILPLDKSANQDYSEYDGKQIKTSPYTKYVTSTLPNASSVMKNQFLFNNNPDNPMVLVPLSILSLHSSDKSFIDSKVISNRVPNSRTVVNTSDDTHKMNEMLKLDSLVPMDVASKDNSQETAKDPGLINSHPLISKPLIDGNMPVKRATEIRKCKYVNYKEYKQPRCKWHSETTINGSFNLCQVCGEMAGKHNYYDGRSCQSCRAFLDGRRKL